MADAAETTVTDEDRNPRHSPEDTKTPGVSCTGRSDSADSSQSASSLIDSGHNQRNGSSPILHPPKLTGYIPGSTVFGGSPGIPPAVFSNPFLPRPPLRTDVVSTGGSFNQSRADCIIAPGRLNPFVSKTSDTEIDSGDERHQARSVLTPSKMGFMNKEMSPNRKFQLRPSALKAPDSSTLKGFTSSILKPARLPDPRKPSDHSKDFITHENSKACSGASSRVSAASCDSPSKAPETHLSCASDLGCETFAAELSKNNQLRDSVSTSVISSSQSGFVFGENLSQRVTGVIEGSESGAEAVSTSPRLVFGDGLSGRAAMSNGTSASPLDGQDESGDNEPQAAASRTTGQTLEESAREYQAKHDNRVDLKEVQVITGEENESNVMQANAKLFVFDSESQSWVERGRGTMRLNDMSPQNSHTFQSRLVMRTQGSLRVILNTKIWSGMNVERASTKAIRITATDTDQVVKVFLIMTNTKDSENLLRAIDWRIQQLKIHEDRDKQDTLESHGEKRKADADLESPMYKQKRVLHENTTGIHVLRKEESDSSVQDPETEASCESHSSSLTVKSESD